MTANEAARRAVTADQARAAGIAARDALQAHRLGNPMNDAFDRLFFAVGYWMAPKGTAEFRGDRIPPKMLRMPRGRAVEYPRQKWVAAEAWAAVE